MRALSTWPRRLAVTPTVTLTVTLTLVLLVSGCAARPADSTAADAAASAPTPLTEQTATAGPVEVRVTPERIDAKGAAFAVVLDNHEIELTGDYAARSALTVDGRPWGRPSWSGDGPGGHHREGTLTFSGGGPAGDRAALSIGGLPEPVVLTWTLP